MATFPLDIVKRAWERSGGRCECTRTTHGHLIPHRKALVWANRGRSGRGCWEPHSRSRLHLPTSTDCLIYCWDCHHPTFQEH